MNTPRKFCVRLVIGMMILSTLGWLACAGKAPSAIGLICNKNGSSTGAKCWGKGVTCSNGYCRESETKCSEGCKNDKDCRSKMDCGDKINCNNGNCEKAALKCLEDSCTDNSDCVGCSEGRTTCAANVCLKSTCGNCKENEDCRNCGGNTKCIGGRCEGPRCVPGCKTNEECADCPNGNKICLQGMCVKEDLKCLENSCTDNNDCAGCPDSRTTCRSAVCLNPKCGHCKNDNDCTDCQNGDKICHQGRCEPPLQVNMNCSPPEGGTCPSIGNLSPFKCGIEGFGTNVCTKDCKVGRETCDQNKALLQALNIAKLRCLPNQRKGKIDSNGSCLIDCTDKGQTLCTKFNLTCCLHPVPPENPEKFSVCQEKCVP